MPVFPETSPVVNCCILSFDGPKDLIAFRSLDDTPHSHASISILADASVSWDIIVAGTPVGSCLFRCPARTEVIEVSDGDEDRPVQQYHIADDDDFDHICQLEWFQGILRQCDHVADSPDQGLRIVFLRGIGACDLHLYGNSDEIKRIANIIAADWNGRFISVSDPVPTVTKLLLGVEPPPNECQVLVVLHFLDLDRFKLVTLPPCFCNFLLEWEDIWKSCPEVKHSAGWR